jgi:AcrR family transcriptional regulator
MEVKLDLKHRIVGCAHDLFFKMGFRRVTMDDIAAKCGVSKKTIYQHFKDKDTVVLEVTRNYLTQEEKDLDKIHQKASDPIEELVYISKWFREMLSEMDPSLVFDMKKYHHAAWSVFNEHKEKCMFCSLIENLEKGKELGLYRRDINNEILSKFRVESTELLFNPEKFHPSEFNIRDVQMAVFDHFVYGIVTDKGKALFEKHKKIIS